MLAANIDILHKMAEALLEKEVLDGAEIDEIVRLCGRENGAPPLAASGTDACA